MHELTWCHQSMEWPTLWYLLKVRKRSREQCRKSSASNLLPTIRWRHWQARLYHVERWGDWNETNTGPKQTSAQTGKYMLHFSFALSELIPPEKAQTVPALLWLQKQRVNLGTDGRGDPCLCKPSWGTALPLFILSVPLFPQNIDFVFPWRIKSESIDHFLSLYMTAIAPIIRMLLYTYILISSLMYERNQCIQDKVLGTAHSPGLIYCMYVSLVSISISIIPDYWSFCAKKLVPSSCTFSTLATT